MEQPSSHVDSTTPGIEPPKNKPILTKAIGSVLCGLLSLPTCFCFGVPSILLGGLAVYLGVYVQKNYRDSTASEIANIYAWGGIGLGCIGIVLGIIGTIMFLMGTFSSLVGGIGASMQ